LNSEDNLLSDMKDALEKAKEKISAMIEKGIDDDRILPKFENDHDERRFWYVLIAIISLSAILCIALILGLCCCCKKAKELDESEPETTYRSKKKSSKSTV